MLRRLIVGSCFGCFALSLGCGSAEPASNPNNLEYSKEGPPQREGPGAPDAGGGGGGGRVPSQPK